MEKIFAYILKFPRPAAAGIGIGFGTCVLNPIYVNYLNGELSFEYLALFLAPCGAIGFGSALFCANTFDYFYKKTRALRNHLGRILDSAQIEIKLKSLPSLEKAFIRERLLDQEHPSPQVEFEAHQMNYVQTLIDKGLASKTYNRYLMTFDDRAWSFICKYPSVFGLKLTKKWSHHSQRSRTTFQAAE